MDYHKAIGGSVSSCLIACNDNTSDVRMAADETLNRIIKLCVCMLWYCVVLFCVVLYISHAHIELKLWEYVADASWALQSYQKCMMAHFHWPMTDPLTHCPSCRGKRRYEAFEQLFLSLLTLYIILRYVCTAVAMDMAKYASMILSEQ